MDRNFEAPGHGETREKSFIFEDFEQFQQQNIETIENVEGRAPVRLLSLFSGEATEVEFRNGDEHIRVEKVGELLVKIENTYSKTMVLNEGGVEKGPDGENLSTPLGAYYGGRVYFIKHDVPVQSGNPGEMLVQESWIEPAVGKYDRTTEEGFKDTLISFLLRDESHPDAQRGGADSPHSPLADVRHFYQNFALQYGSHPHLKVFFSKALAIDFAKQQSADSAHLDEQRIETANFGVVSPRRVAAAEKILSLLELDIEDEAQQAEEDSLGGRINPRPDVLLTTVHREIGLHRELKTLHYLNSNQTERDKYLSEYEELVKAYQELDEAH